MSETGPREGEGAEDGIALATEAMLDRGELLYPQYVV